MGAQPPSPPTHVAAKGRWLPPTWSTSRAPLAVACVRPVPILPGVPLFKRPSRAQCLISKPGNDDVSMCRHLPSAV
ncbi:hypothetical protein N7522_011921 [Penicillium canescens]|nr:hypothetical protein N7522_011921 [Penicillium canescens]